MSCTFWNLRRKKAAEARKAKAEAEAVKTAPEAKKPTKKGGDKDGK